MLSRWRSQCAENHEGQQGSEVADEVHEPRYPGGGYQVETEQLHRRAIQNAPVPGPIKPS